MDFDVSDARDLSDKAALSSEAVKMLGVWGLDQAMKEAGEGLEGSDATYRSKQALKFNYKSKIVPAFANVSSRDNTAPEATCIRG